MGTATFETNPMFSPDSNQAQDLSVLLDNLIEKLVEQRNILQQRGMNLPPGTLKNLQRASGELKTLGKIMLDQQVELNRLHALVDTAALINSSLETDEVLRRVMDTVIQLTGAERGYIVLRDPKTSQMQFRIHRNLDRESIEQGSFIVSRTIVDQVAQTGEPVITTNAQSDPRFANQESIVSYALRSILCVPLIKNNEVIGVVYTDNRIRDGVFGEPERDLLYAFANQAAIAIENAQLFEQVSATLREITEYEQLLENVFASISSGVLSLDQTERLITFNEAAERIFGILRDEALNRQLQESLPAVAEALAQVLREVESQGVLHNLEITPTIQPRGEVILNTKLSPLRNYEQDIEGVTILVDDLTDIRQREATLAEVSRYLPPAMVENIRTIDNIDLGGETREITALFADVRGFTSFSETLEPEELMEVINKYLSVSSDAIHLYEGLIDKYMGDAVVGLYNTQLNPQEDHALQAVRAAISMLYDVQALHEILPASHRLFYGIGIDTGLAVLGNVGSHDRKEFTALGKPVNFCKKLQEAAGPNEIMISEATYDLVKDRINCERLERPFRNQTETHIMYKVLGFRRG